MKKLIRLTESDLHRIVNEAINRILYEDKEGYNEVIRNVNRPKLNKNFKKAWNKEKETNPNADYDSFEYRFGCRHMPKGGVK